jgi:hypothetical protein
MAIFEGTVQEFHHHVGPRLRNAINTLARKERLSRKGVCEHCKKPGKILEAAHVHGKDRRGIIEAILKAHQRNGRVRCDIEAVEKQILKGHGPIAHAFKFLCKECHRLYDTKPHKARANLGAGGALKKRVRRLAWAAAILLGLALLASAKP